MENRDKKQKNRIKFVQDLPDLMTESDYNEPGKKKVRVRIVRTKDGVEILGDSMYPILAEAVLRELGDEDIERTLCG